MENNLCETFVEFEIFHSIKKSSPVNMIFFKILYLTFINLLLMYEGKLCLKDISELPKLFALNDYLFQESYV